MSSSPRLLRKEIINRGRNLSKADIYDCEYGGRRAILKDYGGRCLFIRSTVGRWFAKREYMIYQELQETPGVPRSFIMPDPCSFLLEYVDGKTLPDTKPELITPPLFQSLKNIIQDIHGRGIACGDIHHRDILITPDGRPCLIDFVTGWRKGGKWNLVRNFVFRWLCSLDWLAYYRIREKYTGIRPSEDEKKEFSGIIFLYYPGRLLKRIFNLLRGKVE